MNKYLSLNQPMAHLQKLATTYWIGTNIKFNQLLYDMVRNDWLRGFTFTRDFCSLVGDSRLTKSRCQNTLAWQPGSDDNMKVYVLFMFCVHAPLHAHPTHQDIILSFQASVPLFFWGGGGDKWAGHLTQRTARHPFEQWKTPWLFRWCRGLNYSVSNIGIIS